MTAGTVAVLGVALLFAVMGVGGLLAPAAVVRPFGLVPGHPAARSEVRAVYGGFGVAVAGVLTAAALGVGGVGAPAVHAVAVALLGMAGGRLAGHLVEGPGGLRPSWWAFGVEVAAAAVLLPAAGAV